jgi:hypothetical protein
MSIINGHDGFGQFLKQRKAKKSQDSLVSQMFLPGHWSDCQEEGTMSAIYAYFMDCETNG